MRLRAKIVLGCVVCLLGCVLTAASGDTPATPTGSGATVGAIRARGTAFADLIDQLRDATSQNIFVNWRALKACRVTKDLPVTIDLSNLPLDRAMDRLLDHVGGPYVRLGYAMDEGVITISTAVDLCKNSSTRVYDVRASIKDGPGREKEVEAIVRRVEGVDPLSWKQTGGEMGEVRELGGQLIVTATPEVQNLVAEELRDVLPASQGGGGK